MGVAYQRKASSKKLDIASIRREMDKELSFEDGINTALVSTILDKVVVKKESTKEEIHLDIYLKLGHKFEAVYEPKLLPASISPPKKYYAMESDQEDLISSGTIGLITTFDASKDARLATYAARCVENAILTPATLRMPWLKCTTVFVNEITSIMSIFREG